jgi:hypothetical protein
MYQTKIKHVVRLLVVLAAVGFGLQLLSVAKASDGPELPAQCASLSIPDGNKLTFHVYARGVQIYKWNGGAWDFVAPVASLFAEQNYFGEVGNHYIGPTWESKSGSKVVGKRVTGTGCAPDPSAIAWLLLEKVSTTDPGIFSSVTYIQRVNTTGGIAPAAAGSTVGEMQEVPYTAEYYFYRGQN